MKKRILFAVILTFAFVFSLVMPASASQTMPASGKLAWAGPPMNLEMKQFGTNCFMSTDIAYRFFDGNLDGSAETQWSILTHGPCPASPNQYKEDLMATGTFTGKVDGKSGTLKLLIVMKGWPAAPGELANIGKIIILSGTGGLEGLQGVLDVTYYMGDPSDAYSGKLHFGL